MSYRYLLDLYDVLDERTRTIREMSDLDEEQAASYRKGRLDCLDSFRSFLKQNYHTQLPRRIRNRLDTEES